MKSLKSVLVVAFACAMLFAFTACEQQMPNLPSSATDKEISKVEFESSEFGFYEAVKATSPVAAKVTVYYMDGTSTNGVTANMTVDTVKAGVNVYPAVISAAENAPAYLVEVTGIAAVGLSADVEAVTVPADEFDDAKTALADLAVNVEFADGYQIPAGEWWTATWNGETVEKTTSVKIAYTYNEKNFTLDLPVTFTTEPDPDTTVASIEASYSDAEWYGDSITVTINTFNAAGEKLGTVEADDYYIYDSTGNKVNSFAATLGASAVNYTVRTKATPYLEANVTIPAGKNYITNEIDTLEVVVADGEKKWTAGDPISVSDFKIKDDLTYAIPDTTSASGEYVRFTISEAGKIKLAEGSNTINYQIQYCIKGVVSETDVKTLTIQADPKANS